MCMDSMANRPMKSRRSCEAASDDASLAKQYLIEYHHLEKPIMLRFESEVEVHLSPVRYLHQPYPVDVAHSI